MMEKKTWKQKIKQFYHSEYMPFAVFGIAIFLMICRVTFQDGDDTYFKTMLSKHSLFEFLTTTLSNNQRSDVIRTSVGIANLLFATMENIKFLSWQLF
jgi:hypothetical protein